MRALAGMSRRRPGAGALVEHAACPERGLGQSRARAALPDQRRLLIAGDAADDRRPGKGVAGADLPRRVDDAGQDGEGNTETIEEFLVPLDGGGIDQRGDGGVGGIGHMQGVATGAGSTREDPRHPRIHRAEAQLTGGRPGAVGVDGVENGHHLGGRRVGGDADAFGLQGQAGADGAEVLPPDARG